MTSFNFILFDNIAGVRSTLVLAFELRGKREFQLIVFKKHEWWFFGDEFARDGSKLRFVF